AGGFLAGGPAKLPWPWATGWLAFRVIGAVLVVPLAEELAFRGYLMRRLIAPAVDEGPPGEFSLLSRVASSGLFGALHGRAWAAGTLAGVVFALALYRRGRLGDAVLAHATANGLLAAGALAGFSWSP